MIAVVRMPRMSPERQPMRGSGSHRVRMAFLAMALLLPLSPLQAQTPAAATPAPVSANSATALTHHPLEDRALVDPTAVLKELPAALAAARASNDQRELALLLLAQANACRVIANWSCQHDAGAAAYQAAEAAKLPLLAVRGLIAESRASIAQQDYTRGERLLGQAEVILQRSPSPDLSADVLLAYSSLSFSLGKHALAAEYADRGLAVLKADQAVPTQARLLRNRARAEALLGNFPASTLTLAKAQVLADQVNDPKLSAELFLESARLARKSGDIGLQNRAGQSILVLSQRLQNSQLAGLGHEVLGLAAIDSHDTALAENKLKAAYDSFHSLGLARDELRVLRELVRIKLGHADSTDELIVLTQRFLELDAQIEQGDRTQAADDFDARLKYAQQEFDLSKLHSEAVLAQQREKSLSERNRLARWVAILSLLLVAILAVFYLLQRRANVRLRSAMQSLRLSDARAVDLLRLSKGFVFLHDLTGKLLLVNPATADALGQSPEAMVGRSLLDYAAESAKHEFHGYLERVSQHGQDEGIILVRGADGSERHWRYSNRLSAPHDSRAYVIGNAVDVTQHVLHAEELRQQSVHDALTGIYNRRYLDGFEAAHSGGQPWAAITVDLDHFKDVNDSEGHQRGDQVLVEVARFLHEKLRTNDAVVRLGGDEFVILVVDADPALVAKLVERIRNDAVNAPCAFSIGSAMRDDAEALSATIARADAAMYQARRIARQANPI